MDLSLADEPLQQLDRLVDSLISMLDSSHHNIQRKKSVDHTLVEDNGHWSIGLLQSQPKSNCMIMKWILFPLVDVDRWKSTENAKRGVDRLHEIVAFIVELWSLDIGFCTKRKELIRDHRIVDYIHVAWSESLHVKRNTLVKQTGTRVVSDECVWEWCSSEQTQIGYADYEIGSSAISHQDKPLSAFYLKVTMGFVEQPVVGLPSII